MPIVITRATAKGHEPKKCYASGNILYRQNLVSFCKSIAMPTEKEKMLTGALYNPADPEVNDLREKAHRLCRAYNNAVTGDNKKDLLQQLLPHQGSGLYIEPPFFCDYGEHIHAGDAVYFNTNCVILDSAPVTIGHNCLFGPAVQIYTPLHPMQAAERNTAIEYAQPVTIGNNVWVGGNATILPGVTIGDNCVIGAGSVVTKDIPANSLAVGNPARVIRQIEQ